MSRCALATHAGMLLLAVNVGLPKEHLLGSRRVAYRPGLVTPAGDGSVFLRCSQPEDDIVLDL
jgi:hypothetical protein